MWQYAEIRAASSNAIMSEKKYFSGLLIAFLTYASNSKHFETKHEYPRLLITQIIDSERGSYLNV